MLKKYKIGLIVWLIQFFFVPLQQKTKIRIDMISKLGNVVSTKYIDVSDIANGGEKEFSIKTNSENVEKYKMSLTDINETNETETKFHEISEVLIGALLVWLIIS